MTNRSNPANNAPIRDFGFGFSKEETSFCFGCSGGGEEGGGGGTMRESVLGTGVVGSGAIGSGTGGAGSSGDCVFD